MSIFKKAERRQAKLKLAISGPSGAGKTYSALLIASGMGGKIAVIDTENNSASLYADTFDFDTVCLEAPFTTDKYISAMRAAEKEGYDVVIIDSATHQWDGDGGINERKGQVDVRGGNSYTNWAKFSPEHNKFLSSIVQHETHLICTVRSKQEYALEKNDKGKMVPQKVGLAPVQRQGFEYEFTVMLDVAMDHSALASKDRTGLFDTKIFKPSKETGADLMAWLNSAKPASAKAQAVDPERKVIIEKIKELQVHLGIDNEQLKAEIFKEFKVAGSKEMSTDQLRSLTEMLYADLQARRSASPALPDGQPSFAEFRS